MRKVLSILIILCGAIAGIRAQSACDMSNVCPTGIGGFAFVQSTSQQMNFSGTTCSVTMGSNVALNDLVLMASGFNTSSASSTTVTTASGTATGTWVSDNSYQPGSNFSNLSRFVVTGAGSLTITATNTVGGVHECQAAEFSGNATSPHDATNGTEVFGASPATVTTTGNLAQNNELVVGWFFSFGNALTGAAGSGFTLVTNGGGASLVFEYDILSGGTGATATATAPATGAGTIDNGIDTYKP